MAELSADGCCLSPEAASGAAVGSGVGAKIGVGGCGVAVGRSVGEATLDWSDGVGLAVGSGGLVSTTAGSEAGLLTSVAGDAAPGEAADGPERQAAAVIQRRRSAIRTGPTSRVSRGIMVISVSYLLGVAPLYDPDIPKVLLWLSFATEMMPNLDYSGQGYGRLAV